MKEFDENIYIPYGEAKQLNGLGYDLYFEFYKDSNEALYDMRTPDDAPCILWQNAFKWFREEHGLWFRPDYPFLDHKNYAGCIHKIGQYYPIDDIDDCESAEEAELACLRKLIEIIKKK
jgi:hypothetical protein